MMPATAPETARQERFAGAHPLSTVVLLPPCREPVAQLTTTVAPIGIRLLAQIMSIAALLSRAQP